MKETKRSLEITEPIFNNENDIVTGVYIYVQWTIKAVKGKGFFFSYLGNILSKAIEQNLL